MSKTNWKILQITWRCAHSLTRAPLSLWSVYKFEHTHFSERCFRSNRFPCREFKSQHTNLRPSSISSGSISNTTEQCMASFFFCSFPFIIILLRRMFGCYYSVVFWDRETHNHRIPCSFPACCAHSPIDFFTYGSRWSLLPFHFVPFFAHFGRFVSLKFKYGAVAVSFLCLCAILFPFCILCETSSSAQEEKKKNSKIACDSLTMQVTKVLLCESGKSFEINIGKNNQRDPKELCSLWRWWRSKQQQRQRKKYV